MKKYKQLCQEQRYTIECMIKIGHSQKDIAKSIGVDKSTISRELQRNVNSRGRYAKIYDNKRAQSKATKREIEKPKRSGIPQYELKYIRKKLILERWSPEYISKRGSLELGQFVSHETIYKYIWTCKHSNAIKYKGDKDLHKYLKHHGRRTKRKNINNNRGCIANRVPISKRPKVVSLRKRRGDYEVDLMIGKNRKPALIVLTDRKLRLTELIKIENKKAKYISKKIIERVRLKSIKIHTMTFDNGLEFADHQIIAKALGIKTYFTRPYTSQDKGSVENRIGVIRRFLPKGTDVSKIHHNTIRTIESKINNRPLRIFDYLTPNEKNKLIKKVALVT